MPFALTICGIFVLLIGAIWFICEKFEPAPGSGTPPALKIYAPFYSIMMMAALLVGLYCWLRDYRQAALFNRRILRCVLFACVSAILMVFDVVSYPLGVLLTFGFWCGMLYLAVVYTRQTAEKHSQTMLWLWASMLLLTLVLGMTIFVKFLIGEIQ